MYNIVEKNKKVILTYFVSKKENIFFTRFRRFCLISDNFRSVYLNYKVTRFVLKQFSNWGLISGLKKMK